VYKITHSSTHQGKQQANQRTIYRVPFDTHQTPDTSHHHRRAEVSTKLTIELISIEQSMEDS